MVREYRHLKMLKRAMRGYDPGGVMATQPGECAVLCPACPQPGLNLESDWEKASPEKRYITTEYLIISSDILQIPILPLPWH
jgi:hypothetical protein